MGLIILGTDKPPRFACTLCEKTFTEDERHQFERHVLSHPPEDIRPHSPRMRARAFTTRTTSRVTSSGSAGSTRTTRSGRPSGASG
jgi:hypothetical protein